MNKSPFFIIEDLLSPKICEYVSDIVDMYDSDVNSEGRSVLTTRKSEPAENIIYDAIKPHISTIEKYYNIEHEGTERFNFELINSGADIPIHCENSTYNNKEWIKEKRRDITIVIFLSEYQSSPPIDEEFEVYGGKLEFPQHGFGFLPNRGTMIAFPSEPHFINTTAEVLMGSLLQARTHLVAKDTFFYDMENFKGTYTDWF